MCRLTHKSPTGHTTGRLTPLCPKSHRKASYFIRILSAPQHERASIAVTLRNVISTVPLAARPTYFAYSTALTSRITVTLISPGYCIDSSIFLAISRAIFIETASSTALASTITRTSRPA